MLLWTNMDFSEGLVEISVIFKLSMIELVGGALVQ